VVAAARQEGKVVMAVPAEVADEYRAALRTVGARYGFEIEGRAINASEVSQVLMRECSVGRQTVDVVQGGALGVVRRVPAGLPGAAQATAYLARGDRPARLARRDAEV
jgi:hypothetical protein